MKVLHRHLPYMPEMPRDEVLQLVASETETIVNAAASYGRPPGNDHSGSETTCNVVTVGIPGPGLSFLTPVATHKNISSKTAKAKYHVFPHLLLKRIRIAKDSLFHEIDAPANISGQGSLHPLIPADTGVASRCPSQIEISCTTQ